MKSLLAVLAISAGNAAALHCTGACQHGDAHAIMPSVMQLKFEQEDATVTAPAQTGERVNCTDGFAGEYACNNVDLLAYVPLTELGSIEGANGNDMWGWTDPLTLREYIITGQMDGTSFTDISDPINPLVIAFIPSQLDTIERQLWRDIKVYKNHAYIVGDNGDHGMQVFDLTRLRGLHINYSGITQFEQDAQYTEFSNCHNMVINEDTGFGYCVGSSTCNGGLHMIDLSTPKDPEFVGCAGGDGYTHDAQCVVYTGPDERYYGREICFAYNEDSVTIYDLSDKDYPAIISRAEYENAQYTHQGWVTEDHRFLLMNDELDEYREVNEGFTETFIFNIESLRDPFLVSTYFSPAQSIDHNIYIKGDYSYQSNYASGLRINDLSNIAEGDLAEAGFFDVRPDDDTLQFLGTWSNYPYFESGVVAVQSIERGLFLLKPTLPGLGPLRPAKDNVRRGRGGRGNKWRRSFGRGPFDLLEETD